MQIQNKSSRPVPSPTGGGVGWGSELQTSSGRINSACNKPGPAESAGEKIDKTFDKTEKKIDDAADKVEKKLNDK